jgi:hypothetical protein
MSLGQLASPAYAAAVALVVTQAAIGFLSNAVQVKEACVSTFSQVFYTPIKLTAMHSRGRHPLPSPNFSNLAYLWPCSVVRAWPGWRTRKENTSYLKTILRYYIPTSTREYPRRPMMWTTHDLTKSLRWTTKFTWDCVHQYTISQMSRPIFSFIIFLILQPRSIQ